MAEAAASSRGGQRAVYSSSGASEKLFVWNGAESLVQQLQWKQLKIHVRQQQ
jgi:hypothetical protein